MKQEKSILHQLRGWRLWIPLILGLSITVWLLWRSLNETRFIEVTATEYGTHIWIDANVNNEVDYWLAEEFIAHPYGNYREETLSDVLKAIDFSTHSFFWLFMAFLMMGVRDFGYMLRIRTLTENQLTWRQSFFVIMIWEFASALTPGVVGGTAVAMFILNKEKISMGRSTAIVIITALMDNLFFVLIVPLLLLFVSYDAIFPDTSISLQHSITYFFWTGYSIMLLICVLLFLSVFWYPSLIKRILSLATKLPFLKRFQQRAIKTGEEVALTAQQFKTQPTTFWIRVFGSTMLSWSGRYLVINMIMMAFLNISFIDHLLIFAKQFVMWVMMLVSPTPGASGVAEWAFSSLLEDLAPAGLVIVSLALIWRLISYFPYLLIGSLILPRWLKKR
jgi:uncharacterized protein (TIRG00374 family)